MYMKPAQQTLTAALYLSQTDQISFQLQISCCQLCLSCRYQGPAELRQAPISSNSQHSDGNQAKSSLPHFQTLAPAVPAGFASPCTLGINPGSSSGPMAHSCTSAFSSLATCGPCLLRNRELLLLVQPNTSAHPDAGSSCKVHLFSSTACCSGVKLMCSA